MKKWFFGLVGLNVVLYSLPQDIVLSPGMQWIGGVLLLSIFGVICFNILFAQRQPEVQSVRWHQKQLGGIFMHGAMVFHDVRSSKAKSQPRSSVLAQLKG